ncbi:MAG: hypothetical protein CTY38_00775 [Methylotenera sp.]|uniref:hypothetical protein n=1 Tax=Methylotenera sp. TaxID=2051956 RepID=UPI000D4F0443|nr:hypothetical protein [Methylotenera sp.]PPC84612.1 MAG: hypothetical protein CTY38_00775 [Methylotenera sp.]
MLDSLEIKMLRFSAWAMVIIACFFMVVGWPIKSVTFPTPPMNNYTAYFNLVKTAAGSPLFLIGLAAGFWLDRLEGAFVTKKSSTTARMLFVFVCMAIGVLFRKYFAYQASL